jgi:hypothetical protein
VADLLLLKERATYEWEDIGMIRKYSLIMHDNKYCKMRLRGIETKEKS